MVENEVKNGFEGKEGIDWQANPEILLEMIDKKMEVHTNAVEKVLDNRLTGIDRFMRITSSNQIAIIVGDVIGGSCILAITLLLISHIVNHAGVL